MEKQKQTEARNRRFIVLDEFAVELSPIGINRAKELIATDPRAPKPILGDEGGRRIYSRSAVENYLRQVEADGFPHLQSGVRK